MFRGGKHHQMRPTGRPAMHDQVRYTNFCTTHYALHTAHYVLCTTYCALYTTHWALLLELIHTAFQQTSPFSIVSQTLVNSPLGVSGYYFVFCRNTNNSGRTSKRRWKNTTISWCRWDQLVDLPKRRYKIISFCIYLIAK